MRGGTRERERFIQRGAHCGYKVSLSEAQERIGASALGSSFPTSVFILAAADKISVGAFRNGQLEKKNSRHLLAVNMVQHTF